MRPQTFMQMPVNSTQHKKMLLYLLASGSEIQRLRALEAHSQMHSKRLRTPDSLPLLQPRKTYTGGTGCKHRSRGPVLIAISICP